ARHAEIAASLPGAPAHLPLLAANFHRRLARMKQGYKESEDVAAAATREELAFLERLYILTPEEHIRIFIQRRLEELGHGDFVENHLLHQHQRLYEAYRQGIDYLSPELFTLIDGSLSGTSHIDDLLY
ncbi:MAG: hypothetical protein ACNA8W_20980, partial [Bradymonadaceae bacterium]